jgi:hypothetical protein
MLQIQLAGDHRGEAMSVSLDTTRQPTCSVGELLLGSHYHRRFVDRRITAVTDSDPGPRSVAMDLLAHFLTCE